MSGRRITGEKEKKRLLREHPEVKELGRRLQRYADIEAGERLCEIYEKFGRPDLAKKIEKKRGSIIKRYAERTRRTYDPKTRLWRYAVTGRFYDPVIKRTVYMIKGRWAPKPYMKRWR